MCVQRRVFAHHSAGRFVGLFLTAYISRMTPVVYAGKQLSAEYITTASVAKRSGMDVVWKHAFRNIRVQLITVIAGVMPPTCWKVSVLTEIIFFAGHRKLHHRNRTIECADMNAVLGHLLSSV
jgi:peptide/nickel transport system permease protein